MDAGRNNLAVVLGELGDKPAALAAVDRAIALSDAEVAAYQETRTEIEALP